VDASGGATTYSNSYARTLHPVISNRIAGKPGYHQIVSYGGASGVVTATVYGCYWDGGGGLSWSGTPNHVLGNSQRYPDGVCAGEVLSPLCSSPYAFFANYPPLSGTYTGPVCVKTWDDWVVGNWTSQCRGPYGHLYTAYGSFQTSGLANILVYIFGDDLPPTATSSRTIEGQFGVRSGCPSISCRRSGIVDLVYVRYNDALVAPRYEIRHIYSRDGCRTWGPGKATSGAANFTVDANVTTASGTVTITPTQLITGYERVVHVLDESLGMVLLLWHADAWYVRVATQGTTPNEWTLSAEHFVTAGDPTHATLQQEQEGCFAFTCFGPSGQAVYLRCADLQADGGGTWA